jgi:KaiC/GvpD/RAD55 family RecA-like ATPase
MNPTHAALLSVIGHGGVSELRRNNFDVRWLEEGDEKVVIQRALSLDQQGQPVNIASVMQGISVKDWQPIFQAWTDGYGSDARTITGKSKSDYVRRQIGSWLKSTNELYSKSPEETLKWWPKQVMLAHDLAKASTLYNPDPLELIKEPVPEIWRQFKSPKLNEIFSGGVWKPGIVGMTAPTGQGKTTMSATIAGQCCEIGAKCVLFSADWRPSYYLKRLMMYFGFTSEEYDKYSKAKDDSERCAEFYDTLAKTGPWFVPYGAEYMDTKSIKFVLSVELPDVVIVDHMLALRIEESRGNESYAIGKAMYDFRDMANDLSFMGIAMGQLNDRDSKEFKEKHNLEGANFFGSSIAKQAVNLGLLTCRDWELKDPPEQYFVKKKNSIEMSGEIDQVYRMAYDKERASYVDVPERKTI